MPDRWSVSICCSRESAATLSACLQSVIRATKARPTVIDVLVNGNPKLAKDFSSCVGSMSAAPNVLVRIWHIPLADKANAWNWYLRDIWPGGDLVFFVDGYVRIAPDSFCLIEEALRKHPESLAASGVPGSGRSSPSLRQQSLRKGGVHGNLFGVRGRIWAALKARGFHFPIGLYRSDALIGAVLCLGLDPVQNAWDFRGALFDPAVTWTFDPLKWWRPRDLWVHLQRVMRQAQGTLENRAIREHLHIRRRPIEDLAATASALVHGWIQSRRSEAIRLLLTHPECLIALRRVRRTRDWSLAAAAPQLVGYAPIASDPDSTALVLDTAAA